MEAVAIRPDVDRWRDDRSESRPGFEESATVVDCAGCRVVVKNTEGTFEARRAVSCVVAPEKGDLVLVKRLPAGALYVLAILERTGEGATRLSVEGDLRVEARGGKCRVTGSEGVDLVTPQAVTVAADRIEAHAREGRVVLRNARVLANALDSVFDRVVQRVRRSYRQVEQMDHLRAGQVDYSAESTLRLHGENTLMTASELVKVNGDQIHLG